MASAWPGTNEKTIATGPTVCGEPSGCIWHPRIAKLIFVDDGGSVDAFGYTSRGRIYLCDADGSNLKFVELIDTSSHDLEDPCYADPDSDYVYILDETGQAIYEISLTLLLATAVAQSAAPPPIMAVARTWDISPLGLLSGSNGPEGLTFIPIASHPEGGVFAIGTQLDGDLRYVELKIVTSSSDITVTHLTGAPYYSPAYGPHAWTDCAALEYDRTRGRLMWLFNSQGIVILSQPFPDANHTVSIIEEVTEPGGGLHYEGLGIDDESQRTYMADDDGAVRRWDLDWEKVGQAMSSAVIRRFADYGRNIGSNPLVSLEYAADADAWDVPGVDKADAAHTQFGKNLLLVAPADGAYVGVQEGDGEHVYPQCQAGSYFYGIGLVTGTVYRRAVSAAAGSAYTARYTPGTVFKYLWGLPNGIVIGYRQSATAAVYISQDTGATWTLIIGDYASAEPLKFFDVNGRLADWSVTVRSDGHCAISEYSAALTAKYIWYSVDGITWATIFDAASPPPGYSLPSGFGHFHGPGFAGNMLLLPWGDTATGVIKCDTSAAPTSFTWSDLYGNEKNAAVLSVSPYQGRTDKAIVCADGSLQMAIVDVATGAITNPYYGWNRNPGGGSAYRPPYTHQVFYAGGLYYASQWMNALINGRTLCGFICAQMPEGPWSLVSWLIGTDAVHRLIGQTGDGKLLFWLRDFSPLVEREAYYMSPVSVRAVAGLALESQRVDLNGDLWTDYAVSHEMYYGWPNKTGGTATTVTGTGGDTVVSSGTPFAAGDVNWGLKFDLSGNVYKITQFISATEVRVSPNLAAGDASPLAQVARVKDGQYGVFRVDVAATGGPGDNDRWTRVTRHDGVAYLILHIVRPTTVAVAASSYQLCCWIKPNADGVAQVYPYRYTSKQATQFREFFCPANVWTLLRTGAVTAHSTGTMLNLGFDAKFMSPNVTQVELGRVYLTKTPTHSPLRSGDTLTTHVRDGKADVGAYWTDVFHVAPQQSSSDYAGECGNYGLALDQKLYLRSYELGTSYARLYWRGGQQAIVSSVTIDTPSAPYATIVVTANSFGKPGQPTVADPDLVGHWLTIWDDISDPTSTTTQWRRYRIYSVTSATTVVVEDPNNTCSATNHPAGCYVWVDAPRFCLDLYNGTNNETLYCGTQYQAMDLLLNSPVGFAVCLGDNAGDSQEVRCFVANGGAVVQMTRDGSAAGSLYTYGGLGAGRLLLRFANPSDTDEALPGYLVDGGLFAHQTDVQAAALLASMLTHGAAGGSLWW